MRVEISWLAWLLACYGGLGILRSCLACNCLVIAGKLSTNSIALGHAMHAR